MFRRKNNYSKPLESAIFDNPFVLLSIVLLMIIVGQYQTSTLRLAAKNGQGPVRYEKTLLREKKAKNLFQPVMIEASHDNLIGQGAFQSMTCKTDIDPEYGSDGYGHFDSQVATHEEKSHQSLVLPCALRETGQSIKAARTPGPKKEDKIHWIINKEARRHQVDPAIIKAIIMVESSFNPKAVSKKGAMGLMQLMPRTAKYLGVKDSFNPEHNIEGGVRYFKTLLDRFGCDVELALAAYNAGSRNVRKYDGVPPFKATKFYIKKVLTYYETYKIESKVPEDKSGLLT